jgi:hypothetical protein
MWRQVDDPQSDERLAVVSDDIERTERAIAGAKIRLAAAQSTLRANEAIASQPDWSILLAVLARGIGDDVVLRSCHVHPAGTNGGRADGRRAVAVAPAAAPAPATPASAAGAGAGAGAIVIAAEEPPPFVLEASGVARTLASAHRFVNDLEKTGLFARVSLLDTTRDSAISDGAIAFRIECSLDEPAGSSPPTGGAQAAVDKR